MSFSDKQEFSPGIDLVKADLRSAAYRADLISARFLIRVGVRGRINSLFSILCAICRAPFGHTRVITGSDLVHADLQLTACRADLVSTQGFI